MSIGSDQRQVLNLLQGKSASGIGPILMAKPRRVETLARISGISILRAKTALVGLEQQGLVERHRGGVWSSS